MSDYLAYTSGVVRLFDTLDAANAWLAEVGGGKVFVSAERLADAEAERSKYLKDHQHQVEQIDRLKTSIGALQQEHAELVEELKEERNLNTAASNELKNARIEIETLKAEDPAKYHWMHACDDLAKECEGLKEQLAKFKCGTCGKLKIALDSELCGCTLGITTALVVLDWTDGCVSVDTFTMEKNDVQKNPGSGGEK